MHRRKRSVSATLHRMVDAVTPSGYHSSGSAIGPPPMQVQGALIVEDCIKWLETHRGVEEEGIFRISGEKLTIDSIAIRYAKGEKVSLEQICEGKHHDVAGLLKQFLREMKDPLLGFEFYDKWMAAYQAPEEAQVQQFQNVIEQLPNWNRSILKRLMGYAHEVSLHSQQNKMESSNLAIVFAPTLLRGRTDDARSVLNDDRRGVIQFMIEQYATLFMEPQEPDPVLLAQQLESLREQVAKQQHIFAQELLADQMDLQRAEELLDAMHKRMRDIDKEQQTINESLVQLAEMEAQVYNYFMQFNSV
eukprot:TRINITY_DN1510_c0_g1_i1.p1 TRINITY_DN1510_c0_g1~~TRINITY_DN1510_c0_g1_i1.p1  ORF type:complete len:304 (-),score=49.92 TRINITY_DN1510_c0_g1_i1:36-947(-)